MKSLSHLNNLAEHNRIVQPPTLATARVDNAQQLICFMPPLVPAVSGLTTKLSADRSQGKTIPKNSWSKKEAAPLLYQYVSGICQLYRDDSYAAKLDTAGNNPTPIESVYSVSGNSCDHYIGDGQRPRDDGASIALDS